MWMHSNIPHSYLFKDSAMTHQNCHLTRSMTKSYQSCTTITGPCVERLASLHQVPRAWTMISFHVAFPRPKNSIVPRCRIAPTSVTICARRNIETLKIHAQSPPLNDRHRGYRTHSTDTVKRKAQSLKRATSPRNMKTLFRETVCQMVKIKWSVAYSKWVTQLCQGSESHRWQHEEWRRCCCIRSVEAQQARRQLRVAHQSPEVCQWWPSP